MINNIFGNSIQNSFKSFDVTTKMKPTPLDVQQLIMDMRKNLGASIEEKYT